MNTFASILYNIKWNINTALKTITTKKDRRIWLFGAWMGERFADNSRFLFQYLSEEKDRYGIKEAVWVSSKQEVVDTVNGLGYKAFLTDSPQGIYYHYKAGVHVICNSDKKDIDTKRSFGAKKIQLWHGVGIKAVGKMINKKELTVREKLWYRFVKPLLIPGNWYFATWIASSKENQRVMINDQGALSRNVIISINPRLCRCIKYLDSEKEIINKIEGLKKEGFRIVLFLPTFRKSNEDYITPLAIEGFQNFLLEKSIIWIQKKHSADKNETVTEGYLDNIINLDSDFDVNVLYDYIDMLVSDYSSATSDAIFKGVLTLDYCPDYDKYERDDRGFVSDYANYHIGAPVRRPSDLMKAIENTLSNGTNENAELIRVKKFLFQSNNADYDLFMRELLTKI